VVGTVGAAVVASGYNDILEGVPAEGLEPTRSCDHWILSPAVYTGYTQFCWIFVDIKW
jgi:hypothetical protein